MQIHTYAFGHRMHREFFYNQHGVRIAQSVEICETGTNGVFNGHLQFLQESFKEHFKWFFG